MPPADTTRPRPGSLLLDMVLALLTPMFFNTAGRDPRLAREAARQAIAGMETAPFADLLLHAQGIARGIAAMSSYAESMMPEMPSPLAARLRANANTLTHAAERRRGMSAPKDRKATTPQAETAPPHLTAPGPAKSPVAAEFSPPAVPAPIMTAPAATAPAETASAGAVPAVSVPAHATPAGSAPERSASADPDEPPVAPTVPDDALHPEWASAFSDIAREFMPDVAGRDSNPRHISLRAALASAAQHVQAVGDRPAPQRAAG